MLARVATLINSHPCLTGPLQRRLEKIGLVWIHNKKRYMKAGLRYYGLKRLEHLKW